MKITRVFIIKTVVLLIVLVLGVVLLRNIDFTGALKLLKSVSPWFILLFLALSVLVQYFKAISYYLLLKSAGIDIQKSRVVKIFFATQALTFLPGGEVSRIALTKAESTGTTEKVASAVVAQGFIELVSALVVVLLGVLYFPIFRIPALISFIILVAMLIVTLSERAWRRFIKLFMLVKPLKKYQSQLLRIQKLIRSHVFEPDSIKINSMFLGIITFAFISHIVGGLFIYAISIAFGVNLDILKAIFSFSASILIQSLISIVPGGAGFTEGGLIGLLVSFGNSFAKSLALTLTFRVTGLLFNILTGLIMSFIYFRKNMRGLFS